ncbi:MAG: CoA transferase [Pseudomonadales bacterium]|nr:CoA transferase [Pseudomonadales bacterium]
MNPLSGLTALDFGQVYNGPYCGFLMAQAGATVIKVESLKGETLRSNNPKASATYPFALLNSNKKSLAINIKSEHGQELVKRLAQKVDVLSENFAPGTMTKYGIGGPALTALNPRLIYASSTGYGNADGPYRDYLGMDITLQAISGVMSVTGEEDGPPLKTAAAFADFIAGTHLYAAIVTALLRRETTGQGAVIDISMQDCVFPTLATSIGSFYAQGKQAPRAGNRHTGNTLSPYNTYVASDGYIAIICVREGHFKKLCQAMDRPELAEDARFHNFAARCQNVIELDAEITRWSASKSRQTLLALTQAHGVICAPVNHLAEVINDPHMTARGSLYQRHHEALGIIAQMQTPLRLSDDTPPELTGAPPLGANTREVLHDLLGLSHADIATLVDQEAIAI